MEIMKVLFFGDLYGDAGITVFEKYLGTLKSQYNPNLIIINGENIANGRGINKNIYTKMMTLGVNIITMGNWTWSNNEILDFIDSSNIVRPANFKNAPGVGYKKVNINGTTILIINVLGRIFMNANLASPFEVLDEILSKEKADYIFVDVHAEATSEKVALALYLDGRVDAVIGTHTHIQTNDDRKLPKGTLYLTDAGMTGPINGVIGVDKDIVLSRFLTGYSGPNVVAKGPRQVNAVFLDLKMKKIEKIRILEDDIYGINR